MAELRTQYEQSIKSKEQELRELQDRLIREGIERAQREADFRRDREQLANQLTELTGTLERHGIALGREKLDGKMEQLSTLLQEPHRPKSGSGWVELETMCASLESEAGCRIDQQARMVLERLGPAVAMEALTRVQGIVRAQGGGFRRLSPMVQSMAKKVARGPAPCPSSPPSASGPPGPTGAPGSKPAPVYPVQPTSWSAAKFERMARQGAFEITQLRESSAGPTWLLRIQLSEPDLPLTDEAMQVFCPWLHQRLHKVRDGMPGLKSMRQVITEVDMSKNLLGDNGVGRLLQALQRADLRVTTLNFNSNQIGPTGVLALCEFLRGSSPLYEISLSRNQIDDDAAVELIRMFAEHPRYPSRRSRDHAVAAVRLHLSQNLIESLELFKKLRELPNLSIMDSRKAVCVMQNGEPLVLLQGFEPHRERPKRMPVLREGVPEQTPEPDRGLEPDAEHEATVLKSQAAVEVTDLAVLHQRAVVVQFDDDEVEHIMHAPILAEPPEISPRQPIRLSGPPRILQRPEQ